MKLLVSILFFTCITFVSTGQVVSLEYKSGEINGDTSSIPLTNSCMLLTIETDSTPASAFVRYNQKVKKLETPVDVWVWLEMDGNTYFMLGAGGTGSKNPEEISVYNKNSGKRVFSTSGFVLYQDTVRNIVLFDDRSMHNGFYTLYNLNTNTYELYKEPTDCSWGCCGEGQVFNVSGTCVKVTYPTADKNKTISYSRKSN